MDNPAARIAVLTNAVGKPIIPVTNMYMNIHRKAKLEDMHNLLLTVTRNPREVSLPNKRSLPEQDRG